MWKTFFVCKPVCQWLDIRVSFCDGLLVGCSFLKDISAISTWCVGRETTESQCFGLLRMEEIENVDNSDLLKIEIAYNTSKFTAVTRNHGNGQKSRCNAKITVITDS